jgi:hypothetical protein
MMPRRSSSSPSGSRSTVAVGVDEPSGNPLGVIRTDFAGVGIEHVNPVHLHADFRAAVVEDFDVWLAEHDEHVARPVFFSSSDMCMSGLIRALRILRLPRVPSSDEWASKLKAQAISTSKRAEADRLKAEIGAVDDAIPPEPAEDGRRSKAMIQSARPDRGSLEPPREAERRAPARDDSRHD